MEIKPIWNDVTNCQRELILQDRRAAVLGLFSRHPETQLHRRLVEIRDCEMASPLARERLNERHLSVVERAELLLESRSTPHLSR